MQKLRRRRRHLMMTMIRQPVRRCDSARQLALLCQGLRGTLCVATHAHARWELVTPHVIGNLSADSAPKCTLAAILTLLSLLCRC